MDAMGKQPNLWYVYTWKPWNSPKKCRLKKKKSIMVLMGIYDVTQDLRGCFTSILTNVKF